MELTVILAGIQAAIAAAPKVIEVATAAKDLITSLFKADVIDAATQSRVHSHIDAIAEAFANGQTPPEFQVEPDPS